jgi:hypothetical protein
MPGTHRKPPSDKLPLAFLILFALVAAVLLVLALRMK